MDLEDVEPVSEDRRPYSQHRTRSLPGRLSGARGRGASRTESRSRKAATRFPGPPRSRHSRRRPRESLPLMRALGGRARELRAQTLPNPADNRGSSGKSSLRREHVRRLARATRQFATIEFFLRLASLSPGSTDLKGPRRLSGFLVQGASHIWRSFQRVQ